MTVYNFDNKTYAEEIQREAWGYIEYARPLGHFDIVNYELVAAKTKTLHLKYLGRCCSPRECCEERGDTLNSAAGNDFDGEPDCFMSAHIAVEYIGEEEQE